MDVIAEQKLNFDRREVGRVFMSGLAALVFMGGCASAQEKQPDYTSRVPQFTFANTLAARG